MAKTSKRKPAKPAKKAAPRRAAGKTARARAPKAARPGKRSTPVHKGPRSQALPGMETVRHNALDNICEAVAEFRAAKNRAIQSENGELQRAMKYMPAHNVTLYRHAGIELVFAPGVDHLRVRMIKEQGDDAGEGHDAPKAKREKKSTPAAQRDLSEVDASADEAPDEDEDESDESEIPF